METELIKQKIFTIRTCKVLLDADIAALYGVETKRLKEAVRRNRERFPEDFMFELNAEETSLLRSQFASLEGRGKYSKYAPFAFTEQGVAMLSGVLNSEKAIQTNIAFMRAFIAIRQHQADYPYLVAQVGEIKQTTLNHGEQLNQIYNAIENLLDEKAEQQTWDNRELIGFIK